MTTSTLTSAEFLRQLEAERRETHAFRTHPLSLLWLDGKLRLEHVQAFFREFEWFARAAPRLFFCMGAQAPDVVVDQNDWRVRMVANLIDDVGLGGDPSHFAMYREMAYALGLTKEELDAREQRDFLPTTLSHVRGWMSLARDRPLEEGIVGIGLAGEGAISDGTLAALGEAIITHFGISRESARFMVSRDEEIEHGNAGADAVLALATTPEVQQRMHDAFQFSIRTWHTFLDGIYYRLVLPTL